MQEREYQTRAVRAILDSAIGKNKRTLFQLATGAGKTRIATRVAEHVLNNEDSVDGDKGVIFMCHRVELIRQSIEAFNAAGLPTHSSYDIKPGRRSMANDVYKEGYVNVQSAGKLASKRGWPIPFKSFLMVDEAHHAPARSWNHVLSNHDGHVLGLTATPWRLSPREGFTTLFDALITGADIGASTQDLVDNGYLVEPRIVVPPKIIPYIRQDILAGEVSMGRLSKRLGIELVDIPLDEWWDRIGGKHLKIPRTLFFAATQEIAVQQANELHKVGVSTGLLLSDKEIAKGALMPKSHYENREMVVNMFATGMLQVIVNCNIVSEGFDVPAVECVVIGRPTKSLAMYRQMIGRAMRVDPERDESRQRAYVIDCAGTALDTEIGAPMHEPDWSLHPREKLPSQQPPIMKKCESCRTLNWSASQNCEHCGEPFGKVCGRCKRWKSWSDWEHYATTSAHKKIMDINFCMPCNHELFETHNSYVGIIGEEENAMPANAISREEFLAAATRLAASVYDFHARFGIPNLNANSPADCAVPRLCARLAFLMEEVGEHSHELNVGALDDAASEMADVAFVALGTLLEMDALGATAAHQVANKNDNKTRRTHFVEASSGKLIKRSQPL